MKKLSTWLLSAGLLFSMTACSSTKIDDDALTALENGMNQMSNMESATYDADMDMTVMGEAMNLGLQGGYLEKDNKLNFSMILDASQGEEHLGNMFEIYYKDDQLYVQFLGDKMKVDLTEFIDMINEGSSNAKDQDSEKFKKEDIKPYLTFAEMKDDKITLEFEHQKLQDAMKDTIKQAGEQQGYDLEMKVNKAAAVVKLKDETIVDAAFDMDTTIIMDMGSNQKTTTDMKIVLSVAFDDINANKELVFPDFSEYIETDLFDLLYELSDDYDSYGDYNELGYEI